MNDSTPHSDVKQPRWVIWVLVSALVVGLGFRLYYISLQTVIELDGVAYAQMGVNWIQGQGYREAEGIYQWYYPPVYPVQIGLVSLIFKDPELSARILSLLYGMALPVVLFYLGRRIVGWQAALLAAILSALYPRFLDVSAATLAESCFITLYFATAAVAFLGYRLGSWKLLALSGFLAGLAYLTKPAAVPLIGTLGLWLLGFAAFERWGWKRFMAGLLAYTIPIIALSLPWMIHLHAYFGRWTTSELISRNLPRLEMRMAGDDEYKEYVLRPDGLEKRYHASPESPPEHVNLRDIIRKDPSGFINFYFHQFAEEIHNLLEGIAPFRILLFLGMLSCPWILWNRREERLAGFFLLTLMAPLFVFPAVYVSMRYVLPLQPFILLGGSAAMAALVVRILCRSRRPDLLYPLLLIIVSIIALCESVIASAQQPAMRRDYDPVEYRIVGNWIKEHYGPGQRILAYSAQLAYYAEAESVAMPYATPEEVMRYAKHRQIDLIVVDERYIRPRRKPVSPLLDPANAPSGLRLIYNEVLPTGKRVIVYQMPGGESEAP